MVRTRHQWSHSFCFTTFTGKEIPLWSHHWEVWYCKSFAWVTRGVSKSHGTKQVSGIHSIYPSVSVLLCGAIKSKSQYRPLDRVQNLGNEQGDLIVQRPSPKFRPVHFFTCEQGSCRSWKTWKVMEFKNFIFRPGRSWNLIVGPWKSWKIKVLCGWLATSRDTSDDKSKGNVRQRGVIK